MARATGQVFSLDDSHVCSAQHLLEVSGLAPEELEALVDNGVIVPVDPGALSYTFHLHYLVIVTTARRLRDDFELDVHGLILALTLLRRIHDTEAELAAVRAGARS